jgi:hypothetical protein
MSFRILPRGPLAAAALLVPTLLAAQQAAPAAPAAPATLHAPAPEAEFVLEPHRTRWALSVEVNGHPFRFGLDTGGGVTLISPAVVAAAGCTPWGRTTGFQMMGQRLDGPHCDGVSIDIAGHRFTPPITAVLAPELVEPNDRALAGSLALDAFEGRAVTIDFGAGRFIVESPASLAARVRAMTPLPIRLVRELGGRSLAPVVAVPTEHGPLWFELDSGNGGTVLVRRSNAAYLGLDSTAAGPGAGEFALLPSVRVKTDRLFTPDMIIDGNLGMPFLRNWVVTLDLAASRAWIAPTAAKLAPMPPLPPKPGAATR